MTRTEGDVIAQCKAILAPNAFEALSSIEDSAMKEAVGAVLLLCETDEGGWKDLKSNAIAAASQYPSLRTKISEIMSYCGKIGGIIKQEKKIQSVYDSEGHIKDGTWCTCVEFTHDFDRTFVRPRCYECKPGKHDDYYIYGNGEDLSVMILKPYPSQLSAKVFLNKDYERYASACGFMLVGLIIQDGILMMARDHQFTKSLQLRYIILLVIGIND